MIPMQKNFNKLKKELKQLLEDRNYINDYSNIQYNGITINNTYDLFNILQMFKDYDSHYANGSVIINNFTSTSFKINDLNKKDLVNNRKFNLYKHEQLIEINDMSIDFNLLEDIEIKFFIDLNNIINSNYYDLHFNSKHGSITMCFKPKH